MGAETTPLECEVLISEFLREASDLVVEQGGYLDTCNVEGVRALFGLAIGDEQAAINACRAALALRTHLSEVAGRTKQKVVFGIGIATGKLITGMFDFGSYMQYSAVGEALDFSRRLCSINVIYGSHVLISARTFHVAKDHVETRPMEMVSAPKMHQISEVYELIAEKGKLTEDEMKARDAFWHGVVSLRKGGYKEAVGHLKRAHIEGRDDAPLKYFLDRAEAGAREDKTPAETKSTAKHVRAITA